MDGAVVGENEESGDLSENDQEMESTDDSFTSEVEIGEASDECSLREVRLDRTLPVKITFRLKKNSNGNILSIHHTVREENRLIRVRLSVCCFNDYGLTPRLVAIDKRGNVFVFDFAIQRFWKLPLIVLKASIIVPVKCRENKYLIGTKAGQLMILDVARCIVLKACQLSSQPIYEISFPEPSQSNFSHMALVHAGSQAIMFNVNSFKATHRLDFDETRMSLKFACYLQQMEQIFTCFTNDTIHIWSSTSLRIVQKIHPIRIRDRKLRSEEAIAALPIFKLKDDYDNDGCDENDEEENFQLEGCELQNFSEGLIGTYCFTNYCGGLLCLTTMDKYLLLLNSRSFDLQQIFRLKDFVVQKSAFIPQANQALIAVLTSKGNVVVLDCQNTEFKLIIHNCATYLNVSNDSKMLATIGRCGEADIWNASCLYNTLATQQQCMQMLKAAFKQPKPITIRIPTNDCFNHDIRKLLNQSRLQAILKEFGCYPHKYRNIIWCSLLKLPYNRKAYQLLLKLDTPLGIKRRANKLKFLNETDKYKLIKVWSCLGNWCKVFAYSEFLPHLIYPFIKMFPKNMLVVFEICVTLLMNQFHTWFKFHPLPPEDYLGMCENVLAYFDPNLNAFYLNLGITAKDYAWPILSTSFFNVLDEEQWQILWDHILSWPLEFMVFCIVAYNTLLREVIMLLPDKQSIQHFFCELNPIDIRKLIRKALYYMKKCPLERNPGKYFKPFLALPKNVYPKFFSYPKDLISKQEEELMALKREEDEIEKRMRILEMNEQYILKELEDGLKREEHAKRLKEMETLYHDAIKREEERVACQRKLLCLYQKELRGCKGQVLATLRESDQRKRAIEMETQLDKLIHKIERERCHSDSTMILAEDELKNQNFEVLAQRYYLDQKSATPNLAHKFSSDIRRLADERSSLRKVMNDFLSKPNAITEGTVACSSRDLNEIERKLDEIQSEFLCLTKSSNP